MFKLTGNMFKTESYPNNEPFHLPPPIAGINPSVPLMAAPANSAVILDNWFPRLDGLGLRTGFVTHVSAFSRNVDRLHVYSNPSGAESIFASTSLGIYDCTTAGAMPAPSIALTNGSVISVNLTTGAGSYLLCVNGIDTLKQFDGTTWTSVPTLGTSTILYNYVEVYRQRVFFAKRNSLEIEYLAPNSFGGTATNYPLGAIFRQGGHIVALGTWTIDSGAGPDDKLAVLTDKGEIAVFNGNDPATWTFQGVYFAGRPIGQTCTFKYGGDLLIITEEGIRPLSSLVQTQSIDRTLTVSSTIRQLVLDAAISAFSTPGWQLISNSSAPYLLLNVPLSPNPRQFVMNSSLQSAAWCTFSGIPATFWARKGGEMYFGTKNSVCRVTGVSDNGANITATMLQAYNRFGYPREKQIVHVKPYFTTTGQFTLSMGAACDFMDQKEISQVVFNSVSNIALWGAGTWGTSIWSSGTSSAQDWETIPDEYSLWKAIYLQVTTNTAKVTYLGSAIRFVLGSDF